MKDHSFIEKNLLLMLRRCAKLLAKQFNLKYKNIFIFEKDDPDAKSCWGIWYPDGTIFMHIKDNKKYCLLEELLDTLVHELAHTQYATHSKCFWRFHRRMKRWLWKELY